MILNLGKNVRCPKRGKVRKEEEHILKTKAVFGEKWIIFLPGIYEYLLT